MKKLIFGSILIATILAGGIVAYSIWRATPQTAEAFFASGKGFYDSQKYPEATIQLLNAVRQQPAHRDSRYFLALSYVGQQDFSNAARQLQALLEYHPDDIDAELQLGRIYLAAGRGNPDLFREAQKLAGKILEKDPSHVGALILSGNAAAGLQDYRASVDLFEKAISLDPNNLPAFVSLGTTQALQKNYPAAEQAFLKARQVNPKDKSALLSLGNYYRAAGEPAKAEAILKEALSFFPKDRDIYFQAVTFYAQNKRYAEAEKILRDAQAAAADDPAPSLILVDLIAAQAKAADARKFLLELKDKYPKNIDVAVKVALNLLQDQPDRAQKEIDQIIKDDAANPIGHVLLGELQFFTGKYDDAEATLGKNPALDSRFPQAHFFLGNIALRKGMADQAIFHYQKALAVESKYLPARVALAEVFLNQGKTADSREELRKAMELSPDFAPARLLQAALDRGDKKYVEAERGLNALIQEQPDNAFIQRQMAAYNESRGRSVEAEKNLMRALTLQPDSPEVFRELVMLHIRSKQYDKALERINAVPDAKKQAFHYELAGLVNAQAGKPDEAEKQFKKALEKDPSMTSANNYLFAFYMKAGKTDEGMKKLDDIIKQDPKNSNAIAVKGLLFQSQGNLEEAKRYYREALKIDPNAEAPANNLAWLLAEEGNDLNTALGLAQMARKKKPEDPNIADTLGWVYYKLGNHILARDQVSFAASRDPENPEFQYHLGLIFKETKQYAEAQAALRKAIGSPKEFKFKSQAQAALNQISGLK